jgi:hypothetical protein
MLLLAAAGGWIVAALCFWVLNWVEKRRALHTMGLDDLKTLLAQVRDELKARTPLSDTRSSIDREVEKLYDDTRE